MGKEFEYWRPEGDFHLLGHSLSRINYPFPYECSDCSLLKGVSISNLVIMTLGRLIVYVSTRDVLKFPTNVKLYRNFLQNSN